MPLSEPAAMTVVPSVNVFERRMVSAVNEPFAIDAVPSLKDSACANTTLMLERLVRDPADTTALPSVRVFESKTDKPVRELFVNDALPSVKESTCTADTVKCASPYNEPFANTALPSLMNFELSTLTPVKEP